MTIAQMRYYAAVCEHLSFTKASEVLGVTQPAISSAIKELEKECQVRLIAREQNQIRVTDEGLVLLEEIRPLIRQYDQVKQHIGGFRLSRNYVRVGFTTLFGNYVYSDLLVWFRRRQPDIRLLGEEGSIPQLFQMLERGRLDVVLAACPPNIQDEKFRASYARKIVDKIELRFCVNAEHPFAAKSGISLEEAAEVPLILLSGRFSQSERILQDFTDLGLTPNVIHVTDQVYTVERFIENNAAAGFLPARVAAQNRYMVGIPLLPRREESCLELFWKKDAHMFQSVRDFIQLVDDCTRLKSEDTILNIVNKS